MKKKGGLHMKWMTYIIIMCGRHSDMKLERKMMMKIKKKHVFGFSTVV